jgi:GTP-binding protein YchF
VKVGIIGLPNAGKSSLFNLLTGAGAKVDLYPFTTVDRNVGVVQVPDPRLERIGALLKPEKLTPAHVDFTDIAGLVKGASHGEGLGNRFLAHVREAHLLLHLVRNYAAPDIPHVFDTVDPDRDVAVVEAELAIADLAVVEKRLDHVRKEPKGTDHDRLLAALEALAAALAEGLRAPDLHPEERAAVRDLGLFVLKPVVCVVNCSDTEPADPAAFPRLAARDPLLVSTRLEEGLAGFSADERAELRTALDLAPDGPDAVTARAFAALDLIRFYTVKGPESRAWAAPRGITAVEAAGLIHSDLADGFIRTDVLRFDDLEASGGFTAARDAGKVKVEGRNYVVQDGDVLLVKFRT